MESLLNRAMVIIAFKLTDVTYFCADFVKHYLVHLGRPRFLETSRHGGFPDAVMVVGNGSDTRQIPIRLRNRWFRRRMRGVAATHSALFPIVGEALVRGYKVRAFLVCGETYHVSYENPDRWVARSISITIPSLI